MKISEMTNDQATEAMIRLSGPISAICDDEDAVALVDKTRNLGQENVVKAFAKLLPAFVTFGLKKHRQDLYEIIGALTQRPTVEVGTMNFAETVKEIRNSYDDILAGFFTESAFAGKPKEKESV